MKKYTEEEKQLAINMWEESGLSQAKWCQQEGISRKTFGNWVRSRRNDDPAFLPMQIEEQEQSLRLNNYEITYPNGIIVKCPAGTPVSELQQLLSFHV